MTLWRCFFRAKVLNMWGWPFMTLILGRVNSLTSGVTDWSAPLSSLF